MSRWANYILRLLIGRHHLLRDPLTSLMLNLLLQCHFLLQHHPKLSRLFSPTDASLVNSQLVFPALSLVVKPNELHSALARPLHVSRYEPERSGYYLVASLAYGIINGYPFMDGNKRTAFFLYSTYLQAQSLPGLTDKIAIDDHESLTRLADRFIQAACGKLDVEGLVADDSRESPVTLESSESSPHDEQNQTHLDNAQDAYDALLSQGELQTIRNGDTVYIDEKRARLTLARWSPSDSRQVNVVHKFKLDDGTTLTLNLDGEAPRYFAVTRAGSDAGRLARATVEILRDPKVHYILEYLRER